MAQRMKLNVFGMTNPDMISSIHKAILSLPATDIGVFCSPSYAVLPGFCVIFSVDFQVFSAFSVSPFKWNIACQNLPYIVYFS